jgi:undecaprenyl-diphosphatase
VISYFQAIVIGVLQGVTELFPISSLGHSVLVPAWLGWHTITKDQSSESPYLAFLVALHVATALALLVYFRNDWVKIIGGFFRTFRTRQIETVDEKMAWLLVVATIPAGLFGLVFEHSLRTLFAKPLAAAIFLTINGCILMFGEWVRRRSLVREVVATHETTTSTEGEVSRRSDSLNFKEAVAIGVAQVGALFAGISRSGITMVAGLVRGLDHEDAARFTFLLATPIILAAGLLKIPDLTGHLGDGIRGQALVGGAFAAVAAFISVRFLVRFFQTRNLLPFAIYCLAAGAISIIRFA